MTRKQALFLKFPELYRDIQDLGGISIDSGWYPLVESLSVRLQDISDRTGIQIRASQVKQKFGDLKFYYQFDEEIQQFPEEVAKEISDTIDIFEKESSHTCEICGSGETTTDPIGTRSWVRTLCGPCKQERERAVAEGYLAWESDENREDLRS